MNFSLKPHQLVAHWVPGFILLILIPALYPGISEKVNQLLPTGDALRGFVWAVLAFVLGQLLDAVRNLLENVWDRWSKVNWAFFIRSEDALVERLRTSWFRYYVFDHNLALSLLCFSIVRLVSRHFLEFLIGFVATCIFVADAYSLRKEIAKHTKSSPVG